jgi:Predicted acid phosphatase
MTYNVFLQQPFGSAIGYLPSGVLEEDTDFGALKAGYVSITPLQLDLTAR